MQKGLSIRTKKEYDSVINLLEKRIGNINNITIDMIISYIKDNNLSSSRENMVMSAILYRLKCDNDKKELCDSLRKRIRENIDNRMTEYLRNELKGNEKKNYLNWGNIKFIHEKIGELLGVKEDKELFLAYVILSLYIYQCPRRIEDYQEMYIKYEDNNIKKDEILWTERESILKYGMKIVKSKVNEYDRNYYIQMDGLFEFNKYKTQKKYGRQIIEVSKDLRTILDKYIKNENKKEGDRLFSMSVSSYVRRLESIFVHLCGKKVSVCQLRHAYISNELKKDLVGSEKKYISDKMGHSLIMQMMYDKKNEDKEDQEGIRRIIQEKINEMKTNDGKNVVRKGRPIKYDTEELKEECKKQSKRKWLELKGEDYVRDYNKEYYQKHNKDNNDEIK